MLAARGYEPVEKINSALVDSIQSTTNFEEFTKNLEKLMTECNGKREMTQTVLDKLMYTYQHSHTKEIICVVFTGENIGNAEIKTYVEEMKKNDFPRIILVSVPFIGDNQSVLTAFAHKEIDKCMKEENIVIEHFYMHKLLFNVMENEYQPKSVKVLTDEEKINVLKINKVELKQLHHIYIYDPLARFLGLRINDVIECKCNSESTGETIRYRVCVE